MKAFDVHPEELLDREPRGVLTDEQRALLDAHLVHCESCRLERLLRADFAGEALRADEADMQSFVLGALQRAASVEAAASAPAAAHGGGTRRRVSAVLLVACIVLMAAGAAAARTAWVERIFEATFGAPAKAPRAVRAGKRAVQAHPSQAAVASAPEASEAASVSVAPEALAEAAPDGSRAKTRSAPKLVPVHKNLKRRAPQVAPRSEPQRAASAVSAGSAAVAQAAKSPLTAPVSEPDPVVAAKPEPVVDEKAAASAAAAAALFEQANRARRSGRLEQAAELYADLQTSFGKSAEARLSYALAARMWLDSGNAFAAHGGFEQYLASGDRALREEAMAGRALSLERLGRSAAADHAFAELLREYPYSSYAHLAKKRLGQD